MGYEKATRVTVRYWARARAVVGVSEEVLEGATLAAVLAEVRRRHAGRDGVDAVVAACSVLVSEVPVGSRDHADVVLRDGDTVELLPPFAGG